MNNENEIERMAKIVYNNYLDSRSCARELSAQGIGDKKQAVKKFAQAVKDCLINTTIGQTQEFNYGYNNALVDVKKIIDNLITELYGEDK